MKTNIAFFLLYNLRNVARAPYLKSRLFYCLKIAFVITDGKQTTDRGPYVPLAVASEGLKRQGVTLYGMGIGKSIDVAELAQLASAPELTFQYEGFEDLAEEVEAIKQEICEGNCIIAFLFA